jgi:hypothetical protein
MSGDLAQGPVSDHPGQQYWYCRVVSSYAVIACEIPAAFAGSYDHPYLWFASVNYSYQF